MAAYHYDNLAEEEPASTDGSATITSRHLEKIHRRGFDAQRRKHAAKSRKYEDTSDEDTNTRRVRIVITKLNFVLIRRNDSGNSNRISFSCAR